MQVLIFCTILYCLYAQEAGYKYAWVRSPDSDVFFILLYHAACVPNITVIFETGKGNTRRCIDITAMSNSLSPTYRSSLLSLHAFSGCDSCSAFKGKGKVKPIKTLTKSVRYQQAFCEIGQSADVSLHVKETLEEFTCALYGDYREKHVDSLRYKKLQAKCGTGKKSKLNPKINFEMAALPPCQSCLTQHVNRVNYQVMI